MDDVSFSPGGEQFAPIGQPEISAGQAREKMGADPAGGQEPLGHLISRALSWSFASQLIVRFLRMASNVVLARLLTPRDFGVFTVGAVAIDVLLTLNDLGTTVGIVRARGDVRRVASTGVTIAFAFSSVLYAVCYVAAPLFARALNAPDATSVLRLMTVAVLLDGICAVHSALLTRALRTDLQSLSQFGGFAIGIAVTIAMARMGFGVWSLAWGRVIATAVTAVATIALAPDHPTPGFETNEARKLLRFGLPLAGVAFVQFGLLNTDYLVVGRVLGPVALGFYVLAFNVSSWPVNLLSVTVRRVTVAGFSRLVDNPQALADGFVKSLGLLMTATIPTCLLLSLLASPLVSFLYGSRWLPSVGALQFLVVFAAVRIGSFFVNDLLIAVGRIRLAVWMQLAWLAPLVPALALGASVGGVTGVGAAHAVVALVIGGPVIVFALRILAVRPRPLLSILRRPALAAFPTTLACLGTASLMTNDLAKLLTSGLVGLIVFILSIVVQGGGRIGLLASPDYRLKP